MPISGIDPFLSNLIEQPVASVERVYGGRNNRLYRLNCGLSGSYIAKYYLGGEPDDIKRLNTEFAGLNFLWEHGVPCIPRPVAVDREQGCAVYEYIEGQQIPSSEEVTGSDIDQMVQFLAALKDLSREPDARHLMPASDACFSVEEGFTSINQRVHHLLALPQEGPHYQDLHQFINQDYLTVVAKIKHWCDSTCQDWGLPFNEELPKSQRTLSPSDFGFHNALRRTDGRIIFLDFEYFGWDDPAKMVSDFLLHPAMDLADNLKQRFVTGILNRFQEYGDLSKRLSIAYPLFALKWCLIMLNEFLPEKLSRRGFASRETLKIDELQAQQLAKARGMLQKVRVEYQQFPYSD